jgi:hypothetical protein
MILKCFFGLSEYLTENGCVSHFTPRVLLKAEGAAGAYTQKRETVNTEF